ncbi:xyloside xylosyltransferase 1 isoform X3 [Tamandua tetradactyla]|uniref:xyloside xylosyltransferase 1 isoform X3 n=1 Tax=Tamandua tetradactyla TaxID=48850 RepID=UPI0040540BF6
MVGSSTERLPELPGGAVGGTSVDVGRAASLHPESARGALRPQPGVLSLRDFPGRVTARPALLPPGGRIALQLWGLCHLELRVIFHDVAVLTEKLFPVVEAMQKHFSAGSGTYYSDSIFFLSVAMHQILPKEILQIIQLDLDLKFKTNIRELFEEFDNFLPSAVIGIAREMQPVYRQQESASTRLLSPVPLSCLKGAAHLCSYLGSELSWRDGLNMIKMHTFWQFRHENPKTRVGSPPPEGLPGFNSGVMLLNLEAMRHSPLYSRLLEPAQVQQLANKYHFRGHLGDQDFFTMIGMEHPELFHVLDCTWNRQLCTWWRDHGYSDVFQAYFRCEGHVKIYHGNCNTPIPED